MLDENIIFGRMSVDLAEPCFEHEAIFFAFLIEPLVGEKMRVESKRFQFSCSDRGGSFTVELQQNFPIVF